MTQIHFKGKEFVRNHHLSVPDRPLEPDAKKSVGKPRMDGNLIIRGDNLHALRALLPMYGGRVNCVYIDPPYNTGNEGWCYNDNVSAPWMQAWLQENPVGIEDGLRHDKWCAMLWPRLVLLRELLAEDGVIFISIDDNEQHRLRMMMDEIFGTDNFVSAIIWQRASGGGNARGIVTGHDYVLVYQKCKDPVIDFRGDEANRFSKSKTIKKDGKIFFIDDDVVRKVFGPYTKGIERRCYYEELSEYKSSTQEADIERKLADDEYILVKQPNGKHFIGKLIEKGSRKKMYSIIQGVLNTKGAETMEDLGLSFPNPKPVELVKKLIASCGNKDWVILDSFAGSGTTAHATLALNKEDGGNRKFILVECEDYADKITAERVRRVILGAPKAKNKDIKSGLGGEFTYCTLGEALDMEKILNGKGLPTYKKLAEILFRNATDEAIDSDKIDEASSYIGESKNYHIWLIYKPSLNFLLSPESAFTLDEAKRFVKSKGRKKRHLVFAAARFVSDDVLAVANKGAHLPVDYLPLPWALYRIGRKKKP